MTYQEFEAYLSGLGEELQTVGQVALSEILTIVIRDMIQTAPIKTGRLARSIGYTINPDNSFSIQMIDYGMYQNYGVKGVDQNRAIPVQFGVEPRPEADPFYAFKNRRNPSKEYNTTRYGIKAKNFFDVEDITDFVVASLQERLDNQTN